MMSLWKITALVACEDGARKVTHVLREFYVDTERSRDRLLDPVVQEAGNFRATAKEVAIVPYNLALAEMRKMRQDWMNGRRFD